MNPKIVSLGFAVPEKSYSQEEVFQSLGYPRHFRSIFLNAGISKRHFWINLNPHIGWQQQCEEYERGQSEMTRRVIRACLDNRDPSEIGCIASAGCCGYSCPGIAQRIAKDMNFSRDVFYTNIWGHGCEGGAPALKRAYDFTKATGKMSLAVSCVPSGYDVICEDEPKDIAQITTGDKVLSHDGSFHVVTHTFQHFYKGNIIALKAYNLPLLKVTSEHPVLVYRYIGSNYRAGVEKGQSILKPEERVDKRSWRLGYVPAEQLKKGDFLVLPIPHFKLLSSLKVSDFLNVQLENGYAYTIQKSNLPDTRGYHKTDCRPIRNELLSREFVRLCGLYVAEGDTAGGKGIILSLGSHEKKLIEEAVGLWAALGLEAKVRQNTGKSLQVCIFSVILARLFRKWFGIGARNKKLPSWVFGLPPHLKKDFIEMLWKGDGIIRKEVQSYSTASKILAQQLVLLLATINKPAIWRSFQNKGFSRNIQHNVNLHIGTEKRLWHMDGKYLWCPIKSVEPEHFEGFVYNMEVEAANSYVCNLSSLHNCELCSCAYFPEPPGKPDPTNDFENLRANAIFGDGASAALIGYDDDPRHPYLWDFESYFDPQYIDLLGFIWQDGRLKCRLSREIPKIAPLVAGPPIKAILKRNNLALKDITWWVIHPGGSKVLDNIRDTLGLPEAKMSLSREALYNFGNCSSSSIGIVGKILMGREVAPGDWCLVVSLGAGMAAGATLIRWDTAG